MITLHAFTSMFPGGVGETKDMRVQWALEEMGLPYAVRGWDYNAGECDTPAFRALSPFDQIPVLEDDGPEGRLVIAESVAILIHLAETSGRLIPADPAGRLEVIQWCVAAVATVQPPMSMLAMVDEGLMTDDAKIRDFLTGLARRWLAGLERRLEGRDWIAGDFSIADITLVHVLREIRHTALLDDHPRVHALYLRAFARPAWRRTRELTADRMGVPLDRIG